MYFLKEKISKVLKILNQRLSLRYKIIFLTVVIILFSALIYDLFIVIIDFFKNKYFGILLGCGLILSSMFFLWRNQAIFGNKIIPLKRKIKIYPLTKEQKTSQNIIDTRGGNYNETVQGNYIQGDYINHHVTIQEHQVEVSSNISHTIDEFKEILAQMMVQNSDPIEAISKFAQELAEELHNHPEVKTHFNATQDTNEKELVNIILKLLLIPTYSFQRLNNNDNSVPTYLEEEERDRYIYFYKRYVIDVTKDQNNFWFFKIQPDIYYHLRTTEKIYIGSSFYYFSESAISAAKRKIDEIRFNNWKNNIDNAE